MTREFPWILLISHADDAEKRRKTLVALALPPGRGDLWIMISELKPPNAKLFLSHEGHEWARINSFLTQIYIIYYLQIYNVLLNNITICKIHEMARCCALLGGWGRVFSLSHAESAEGAEGKVLRSCGLRMKTFFNTIDHKWPVNFRECFLSKELHRIRTRFASASMPDAKHSTLSTKRYTLNTRH